MKDVDKLKIAKAVEEHLLGVDVVKWPEGALMPFAFPIKIEYSLATAAYTKCPVARFDIEDSTGEKHVVFASLDVYTMWAKHHMSGALVTIPSVDFDEDAVAPGKHVIKTDGCSCFRCATVLSFMTAVKHHDLNIITYGLKDSCATGFTPMFATCNANSAYKRVGDLWWQVHAEILVGVAGFGSTQILNQWVQSIIENYKFNSNDFSIEISGALSKYGETYKKKKQEPKNSWMGSGSNWNTSTGTLTVASSGYSVVEKKTLGAWLELPKYITKYPFLAKFVALHNELKDSDWATKLKAYTILAFDEMPEGGGLATVRSGWTKQAMLDRIDALNKKELRRALGSAGMSDDGPAIPTHGFGAFETTFGKDYLNKKCSAMDSSPLLNNASVVVTDTLTTLMRHLAYGTIRDIDIAADETFLKLVKSTSSGGYPPGVKEKSGTDGWFSTLADTHSSSGLGALYSAEKDCVVACENELFESLEKAYPRYGLYLPRGVMFNKNGETRLATPEEIEKLVKLSRKYTKSGYTSVFTWTQDPSHDAEVELAERSPAVLELVRDLVKQAPDVKILGVSPRWLRYFSDGSVSSQHPGEYGMRITSHWGGGYAPMLYDGPAYVLSALLDGAPLPGRVYVNPEGRFICSDWCQREIGKSGGIDLVTGRVLKHTILTWLIGPGYSHIGSEGLGKRSKFAPVRALRSGVQKLNYESLGRKLLLNTELSQPYLDFANLVMSTWRDAKTFCAYTPQGHSEGGDVLKMNKAFGNDPTIALTISLSHGGMLGVCIWRYHFDTETGKTMGWAQRGIGVVSVLPTGRLVAIPLKHAGSGGGQFRQLRYVTPELFEAATKLTDSYDKDYHNKLTQTVGNNLMCLEQGVISREAMLAQFDIWMLGNYAYGVNDHHLQQKDASVHKYISMYAGKATVNWGAGLLAKAMEYRKSPIGKLALMSAGMSADAPMLSAAEVAAVAAEVLKEEPKQELTFEEKIEEKIDQIYSAEGGDEYDYDDEYYEEDEESEPEPEANPVMFDKSGNLVSFFVADDENKQLEKQQLIQKKAAVKAQAAANEAIMKYQEQQKAAAHAQIQQSMQKVLAEQVTQGGFTPKVGDTLEHGGYGVFKITNIEMTEPDKGFITIEPVAPVAPPLEDAVATDSVGLSVNAEQLFNTEKEGG